MIHEVLRQIVQTIEQRVNSRPSAAEFEMAYQARVAIDRIRFAIKHTEQFSPYTDQTREANLQLLDALQRLETVDRRFQERSRTGDPNSQVETSCSHAHANDTEGRCSREPANSI